MAQLPFNQGILEWIVENRTDALTAVFQFFTFWGSETGYILISLGLFWLWNKEHAFRVALVTLVSAISNHILKIIIRNPRPFVTEGTYKEKWAVSAEVAEETAMSFSTPSGHAMTSASFWYYLYTKARSRFTLILMVVMILMIGLSRPYLGVHYFEDVILGWIIGFLLVFLILRVEERIHAWWMGNSQPVKVVMVLGIPLLIMFGAGLATQFGEDGKNFATLGGLFAGLTLGMVGEHCKVGFNPSLQVYSKGKALGVAVARFLIGLLLVFADLIVLKSVFAQLSDDYSLLGYTLRFIRYFGVGFLATFVAPLIFVKTGLAPRMSE